jgi:hypothetical protein
VEDGRDRLKRIVYRLGDCLRRGIRLGDQICETGTGLARRVAGRAADDLDDLGEARSVSNRQRVLTPNPVKAFLRHAKRDDDVDMVAIVLLRRASL